MKRFFTIIGGMGTMATESYIRLLNQQTPASCDQDYLNYILVNHASVPDRTAYILDPTKPNPLEPLLEDFKQQSLLKPAFFTLPCNTAHYFYDELTQATDVPIIHMPRETVKEINTLYPNAKKVGLLATEGTLNDGVYDKEILQQGYELVKPSLEIQAKTSELIYDDIKQKDYVDTKLFEEIVSEMMVKHDCDVVILGCTELSLAQERHPVTNWPVVDSQATLVKRTLEWAKELC